MANVTVSPLLRHIRKIAAKQSVKERTDLELMQQFAAERDESAFTTLVERYGPLVWGVCHRVLRDRHDAEDAFQATFLVLARQAGSISNREAASSWLYGVAYRTALSQRRAAQRRREREKRGQTRQPEQPDSAASLRELQAILDEEVARLPAKYRAPFVLCCLEGKCYAHAARELGCKVGTVSSRVAKARKQLQRQLVRRGVTLSSALCATALSPTVEAAPAALVEATVKGVLVSLAGAASSVLSAQAVILANGVPKTLPATALKLGMIVLLAASSLAVSAGLLMPAGTPAQRSDDPFALVSADDKANRGGGEMREEPEMHVIGVYSAKNRGNDQEGPVEVEVRVTSRPVVLVLTSYFSVDWHIKVAKGVRIKKAIVSGYFAQDILGLPAGVPLENRSAYRKDSPDRKGGWFYAYEWNTPHWREMVRRLNEMTGLPVASFQGQYAGESFVIDGKQGRDRGQHGSIPRPCAYKELSPRELLAACADAELHIVSKSRPDLRNPGKPLDVKVQATAKPVVLVLTCGLQAVWNVKCAKETRIKAILVGGCLPQEVDGVDADIPVQFHCPSPGFWFGERDAKSDKKTFTGGRWNTFAYRRMVEQLNDATGLLVSSYQEDGESFIVDGKRGSQFAQKERRQQPTIPKDPPARNYLAACAGAELHVASMYMPDVNSKNGDIIDVEVRPTEKPIVLALVSYMEVLWKVKIAPGARVKAVVIGGYCEQEFEGIPADIPIVYRAWFPAGNRNRDYMYGHEWGSQDTQKMVKQLHELTGRPISTFQGEYTGKSFVIDGKRGRNYSTKQPNAEERGDDDVADVRSQDLRAGSDADKRYLLIGPKKDAKPPEKGYGLFVILPGGDGSADFHPFVKRIYKNALSDTYLAVQPIAIKWTPEQKIVWPTKTAPVAKMKFSTEEFIETVIKEVAAKHKLDRDRVFTLSWSSSGPAAYAISLRNKDRVKGSFIAMSVFNPRFLPPLKEAKGHAYYLYHSPDDRICPYRMAEQAKSKLAENGARVRLETYEGGHGWRGNLYKDIRRGVEWLEKNEEKAGKP